MALSIEWECKVNGCRKKSPHMWYCSRACSYKDNKNKRCEHWDCDQYVDIDARVQLKYCNKHIEGNLKTVTGYLMATRTNRSKEAEAYHYTVKSYRMENEDLKIELEKERRKNKKLEAANKRLESENEKLQEFKKNNLKMKSIEYRNLPIIKRHKGNSTPYASYYGTYKIHPPPPPASAELEKLLKKVGSG